MLLSRKFHKYPLSVTKNKTSSVLDREFQYKYTILITCVCSAGALISFGIVYYFVQNNYQLFLALAQENSPDLLKYIELEKRWITNILISVFIGFVIFFSYISYKMTNKIANPLLVLQNHIRKITRGNFAISPIKVRENDDFKELIETYNYFYNSLRVNTVKDLDRIKTFSIDERNRDAFYAWKTLVTEKSEQLNLKAPLSHVDAVLPPPDSRHAS